MSPLVVRSPCRATRRAKHPSIPAHENIPLSRISDLWHTSPIPALPKGRSRPSRDADRVAMDAAAPARNVRDRAGNRESQATRYDTARSQRLGWSSWVSTREPLMIGKTVRGRRSRVVLTPGVCASSPSGDVAARPGAHQRSVEATGAIVHRSPGRARRTPLKPSAQGRPGDRQHL